ncbi:MAG: DUF4440 domain-containing protein [Candidatus Zixiibacteriota bacterium]
MADGSTGLRLASDSALGVVQKALETEEAEGLASIFTENGAVVTPTGQTIRGRLTLRTMATLLMMTWGGGKLQISRDSLMARDSTGNEIGRFTFRRTPKDEPEQTWSGSYTIVWEREGGRWKVARAAGLLDQPPGNRRPPDVQPPPERR